MEDACKSGGFNFSASLEPGCHVEFAQPVPGLGGFAGVGVGGDQLFQAFLGAGVVVEPPVSDGAAEQGGSHDQRAVGHVDGHMQIGQAERPCCGPGRGPPRPCSATLPAGFPAGRTSSRTRGSRTASASWCLPFRFQVDTLADFYGALHVGTAAARSRASSAARASASGSRPQAVEGVELRPSASGGPPACRAGRATARSRPAPARAV